MHEAAYFHSISQRSRITVDLVQLSASNEGEDSTASVLRAMEEIRKFKAEVVLLYTIQESADVLLQQVP